MTYSACQGSWSTFAYSAIVLIENLCLVAGGLISLLGPDNQNTSDIEFTVDGLRKENDNLRAKIIMNEAHIAELQEQSSAQQETCP